MRAKISSESVPCHCGSIGFGCNYCDDSGVIQKTTHEYVISKDEYLAIIELISYTSLLRERLNDDNLIDFNINPERIDRVLDKLTDTFL